MRIDMVKKIVFICLLIAFCVGVSFSVHSKYVRKYVEPDFFIPAKDKFHQQEKLPPLPKNFIKESDFRVNFNQYEKDINNKDEKGHIPENRQLDEDLAKMNSDDLFEVKEKPHKNDDVSQGFYRVLDESLASY